jgi:hypothetical protein
MGKSKRLVEVQRLGLSGANAHITLNNNQNWFGGPVHCPPYYDHEHVRCAHCAYRKAFPIYEPYTSEDT